MRITLVNQFYKPDLAPTAHLAASLMEHRAAVGNDVRVVTSRGGYVSQSRGNGSHSDNGVRVHRIWTPGFGKSSNPLRAIDYSLFYVLAFLRVVTLPRQDFIISMTTPPLIGLAASFHKLLHPSTKILLWNMDCYPDVLEAVCMIRPGGWIARFLRWLVRLQFHSIDCLVALDDAMADLLVRQYVPSGRSLPTVVIPNWERTSLFPANSPQPQTWQSTKALGLVDRFTIVYLGNTGYGHDFHTVLAAAERLRCDPVRFLFVGGGRRWNEIVTEKESRRLDNILMHPYLPKEETPAVMALADCALITLADWSLGIMSPSKLHANLAMGLPVIYVGPEGSNVDAAIVKNRCGASIRNRDADGLVEFVRRLRREPVTHRAFRVKARAAFEADYSDAVSLAKFDRIFDSLACPASTSSLRRAA